MTSRISHVTIDSSQPYELSLWWQQVIGYVEDPAEPSEPDGDECLLVPPGGGQGVLFLRVPEGKSVKNRLHFDLRPTDRSRDEEVERLLGVGATFVADHRGIAGPGTGWVVLADPEGNEFCILRSDAELAATAG